MERLGGGGHINMAGAQLKDMSMEEAKAIIRETIDNMITREAKRNEHGSGRITVILRNN